MTIHLTLATIEFSKSAGPNSTTSIFINKLTVDITTDEILCEIIKKFPLNSIYGDTSYAISPLPSKDQFSLDVDNLSLNLIRTHFLYRNEPTDGNGKNISTI
uniref:Uncharacterized protein n=1 Tax=Glossina pallidipes TaxID=7398 RepID=A0A1A9ZUQ2_GLOPL